MELTCEHCRKPFEWSDDRKPGRRRHCSKPCRLAYQIARARDRRSVARAVPPEPIPPDPVALSWAAGIIDGEGCISLHTVRTSKGGRCYVLRVTVANTSILMLNRLVNIFGMGNIIPQKRAARYKPSWNWQVCSKKAEAVLTLVEPYLVNKREEARVGLLSRKHMQVHGANRDNPNVEHLAWLKTQLSTLKRVPADA